MRLEFDWNIQILKDQCINCESLIHLCFSIEEAHLRQFLLADKRINLLFYCLRTLNANKPKQNRRFYFANVTRSVSVLVCSRWRWCIQTLITFRVCIMCAAAKGILYGSDKIVCQDHLHLSWFLRSSDSSQRPRNAAQHPASFTRLTEDAVRFLFW